eukprot:scaffold20429_cov102-Isochrysis_galbana.AAC.6
MGPKRVIRVCADKGSTQVRLRARASACGTSWLGPAHKSALLAPGPGLVHWPELAALDTGSECSKDSFGSRSTPLYYHSFGCPLPILLQSCRITHHS